MTLKLSNVKKLVSSNNVVLNGVPTAPTAAKGTNTTQIATTEFVQEAFSMVVSTPAIIGADIASYSGTYTFSFTAVPYLSNVTITSFIITPPNSTNVTVNASSNSGSYTWTVVGNINETKTFRVVAVDSLGNRSAAATKTITIVDITSTDIANLLPTPDNSSIFREITTNHLSTYLGKLFPACGGYLAGYIDTDASTRYYYFAAPKAYQYSSQFGSSPGSVTLNGTTFTYFVGSLSEMQMCYTYKASFNANAGENEKWDPHWYWTSTEYNVVLSWLVNFSSGSGIDYKTFANLVRGLRKFTI